MICSNDRSFGFQNYFGFWTLGFRHSTVYKWNIFQFETKVVSCKPAKLSVTRDGKKLVLSGFEVVCEDTILFPEGGGQVMGLVIN